MANGITLGRLAELAGVSPATVSIVLNRRPLAERIPEVTRERIRRLAAEHHYRPNALAKAMKSQSTGILGFVCGDINQPFYAEFCSELTIAAEKRGYRLMAMLTQWSFEKELDALEKLFSRTVDGVVIISNAFSERSERTDRFRRPDIPLVAVTGHSNIDVCSVASDVLPGMEQLFKLLVESGYRRIAIADFPQYPIKYQAYRECIQTFDLEEEYHTIPFNKPAHYDDLTRRIREKPPEVLIAGSDWISAQLIPRFAAAGLRVPEDLSVATIDGTLWSGLYNPPLTAIGLNIPAMAEASLDILIGRLNGSTEIIEKLIPAELIIRKSILWKKGDKL